MTLTVAAVVMREVGPLEDLGVFLRLNYLKAAK